MKLNPLYSALEQARDLYGVELNEDQFEVYAEVAWRKIGNKQFKTYLTKIDTQEDSEGGWYADKPCNLDEIEAITLNFESARETSPIINYIGNYTHSIEQNIENTKVMPNELYIPGKFVKYKELGDRIYFTEPYKQLNLLYKGLYTDEDGFPYITDKEMDAIALYCAYSEKYKKGIMAKDSQELQIAQLLKKDWLQACNAARLPDYISQNSMNEIVNTIVRRGGHSFGQTYKPIL